MPVHCADRLRAVADQRAGHGGELPDLARATAAPVGKLRRLAALQVRVVPRVCAGGTDGAWRLTALDPTARDLLAQRKGYELLEPDAAHPLAGVGDPLDATSATLVADLLAVKGAAQPPGPALAAWLGRLRQGERVDGVLVLKQEISCLKSSPATRGLLALFSFGVSEAVGADFTQPIAEYLDVLVFETASSRMVWRSIYGRLEHGRVDLPLDYSQDVSCERQLRGDQFRELNVAEGSTAGSPGSDRLVWNLPFAVARLTADGRVYPDPATNCQS